MYTCMHVCIHVCMYVIFNLDFERYGGNCPSWEGKLSGGKCPFPFDFIEYRSSLKNEFYGHNGANYLMTEHNHYMCIL